MVCEAARGSEAVKAIDQAMKIVGEALGAPWEDMGATGEVAKFLEACGSTVMVVEQAANRVHEALGEASDVHSGRMRDVTESSTKGPRP